MTEAEIEQIAEYIDDTFEALYERDYEGEIARYHLGRIRELILLLMNATFEAQDQELKVRLAELNLKAHKCKECIERRLAVWN